MGFLNNLFGSKNETNENPKPQLAWKQLNHLDQLEDIEKASYHKPQLIFKHSATCGISGMVFNRFKDSWDVDGDKVDIHFLDLLSYRAVSNEVAIRFQVLHQSPQVLVIKDGQTIYHASHGGISTGKIASLV